MGRRAVGAVELSVMFTGFVGVAYGFGVYLFAAVLPEMRVALGLSYTGAGSVIALAQVGFLLAALWSAVWTHRLGAVRLIVGSMALCVLCLAGMGWVTQAWQAAALLFLAGGAAAAVWVPMAAVAQGAIAPRHQGKAIGLMSSGTAYGMFVNGVAVPLLLPQYGWRSVWVFVALVGAVLLAWGWLRLSSGLAQPAELVRPAQDKLVQDTAAAPAQRVGVLAVLRQPGAQWVLGMMWLSGVACMPVQNYLMAFLREDVGYTVNIAGQAVAAIGLIGMVGGFLMGALADRITLARALVLTYSFLALSGALFVQHGSVGLVYAGAGVFGLAFNAVFGLLPAYINLYFPARAATVVFGLGTVALGLGSMVGNFLGGYLHDAYGTFTPVYAFASVASLLLAAASLRLKKA